MSNVIKDEERARALEEKIKSSVLESGCVYSEAIFVLANLAKYYRRKGTKYLSGLDFTEIAQIPDDPLPFT